MQTFGVQTNHQNSSPPFLLYTPQIIQPSPHGYLIKYPRAHWVRLLLWFIDVTFSANCAIWHNGPPLCGGARAVERMFSVALFAKHHIFGVRVCVYPVAHI